MKIAGILQTKDYTDKYSTIAVLRQLTDCVIVLDDNSTSPISPKGIDVLISVKHSGPFHCQANMTMLMYQAWVNGCDWVLRMDDDMILSKALQDRKAIQGFIYDATQRRADVVRMWLRDLWDGYDYYRSDGKWGKKVFVLLQRVWFGDRNITLKNPNSTRLHNLCYPQVGDAKAIFVSDPHIVYHTGCIDQATRQRRADNYRKWDAKQEYQDDYAYIMDTKGLTLEPVPPEDKWNWVLTTP